jgi:hypothetical protein
MKTAYLPVCEASNYGANQAAAVTLLKNRQQPRPGRLDEAAVNAVRIDFKVELP